MSSSVRQSELFAGEDWRVLYRAFTEVNFNASDPPSIAAALREYLQANYPEDFNDWIESSEFVFILELLAWLAGTLAFKTDINARENFLETAEARESILRLARFLSYNPRRNQAARGLLKIVEVSTDDDVIDSFGINLNNTTVVWDNPDDPDWMERFTLIMNNAFVQNNQFGQPLKTANVSNVKTQLYRINNRVSQMSAGFSATTNGDRMNFEICNGDFDESSGHFERVPSLDTAFHLCYRSDGNGNASTNTGFFMLFKQGSLERQTFNISTPIENQLIDIETTGVNDSDVWVQTVNDAGDVQTEWTKVPALFSDNITFNSLASSVRNIYSVVTRDDDRISVRFSDGRFGAAPVGNIRVWYRVSNGLRYQIRPQDIDRVKVTIPFTNRRGVSRNMSVTFSLQESVSNSTPRETDEQIRRRAPSVYASQNRMVSGEDYNTFPLQSNVAVKMKAVNRIYSGHSRFIDLNDPTGSYQDTNVFSDDGAIFTESANTYNEIPLSLNRSPAELVALYIQPTLEATEVLNYASGILLQNTVEPPAGANWKQSSVARFSSTGYFQTVPDFDYLKTGAIVEFDTNGVKRWVAIADVQGAVDIAPVAGFKGPVTLSEPVETNSMVIRVIPAFDSTLDGDTVAAIEDRIDNNYSFVLWFDYDLTAWTVRDPGDTDDTDTSILMMRVDYINGGVWRMIANGTRYIFESKSNVQWYFEGNRAIDTATGLQKQDLIKVFGTNEDLNDYDGDGVLRGRGIRRDYDLAIEKLIYYADGYAEPRRVAVKFIDSDDDGVPDDPDTFLRLVGYVNDVPAKFSYLFWKAMSDGTVAPEMGVVVYESEDDREGVTPADGDVAFQIDAATEINKNTFWVGGNGTWFRTFSSYRYAIGRGANIAAGWVTEGTDTAVPLTPRNWLNFQWKHYAPTDHRIDPSKTNIIDIFVLTTEYDFLTRQWVANGAVLADLPLPPSELDLRIAFSDFDNYKMFSDEIIWRPVQYKFLFGNGAINELRTQFKVVKLPNSPLSDGEIKSRVVRAINDYFDVNLWDFGETFYYTELAAYIHQQLASVISSVVLVPLSEDSSFGEGFEVRCRSDELFLSTVQVSDITIINSNTAANLRIH